jgi:hypothetical protein
MCLIIRAIIQPQKDSILRVSTLEDLFVAWIFLPIDIVSGISNFNPRWPPDASKKSRPKTELE